MFCLCDVYICGDIVLCLTVVYLCASRVYVLMGDGVGWGWR